MTQLTHKEMTAHIRRRLKHEGIKARVKMNEACGIHYVTVVTPTYNARWTSEELHTIGFIAQVCRLTGARNSEIDLDIMRQLTGKTQFDFEFHP